AQWRPTAAPQRHESVRTKKLSLHRTLRHETVQNFPSPIIIAGLEAFEAKEGKTAQGVHESSGAPEKCLLTSSFIGLPIEFIQLSRMKPMGFESMLTRDSNVQSRCAATRACPGSKRSNTIKSKCSALTKKKPSSPVCATATSYDSASKPSCN